VGKFVVGTSEKAQVIPAALYSEERVVHTPGVIASATKGVQQAK
jgi:hypothetical protein